MIVNDGIYEIRMVQDALLREEISHYLTQFITEKRLQRIRQVIEERTRHVTVVVEDLFQTQNISAVLRTCECYGIQDVHVIENENEFQIHDAISMGADKWLTLHRYDSGNNRVRQCVERLKQKGYTIVATTPHEKSYFLDELPVETPTAFLFGTELNGLSDEAISLADETVMIPMYGFTESFNISNSVAIILSHFVEKLRSSSVLYRLNTSDKEILFFEWLQKSIKNPHLIIDNFLEQKGLHI